MSNETVFDNINEHSNIDMGVNGPVDESGKENKPVEANTQKPKRIRQQKSKSTEDNESSGERHNTPIQRRSSNRRIIKVTGGGGSTIEQSRSKRRKQSKCEEELADQFGFITDGFTNARSKLRSRKSGKNNLRKLCREETKEEAELSDKDDDIVDLDIESDEDYDDDDDDDSENEMEYAKILAGFMPFVHHHPPLCSKPEPETLLDKVVTAFTGYPVCTHVAQVGPSSSKLVIEIDI